MLQQQSMHPDAEQIVNYANGRLTGDESRFIGRHLSECGDCCQQIEALAASGSSDEFTGDSSSASGGNAAHTEFMMPSDKASPVVVHAEIAIGARRHARSAGESSRYQVFEQLAEGGMGAVYRAHDLHLERDVALKVLGDGRRMDIRLQRFRSEANVLGQLQHPGIPPVFDQGRLPDGRAFIAMKLIEGQTLAELLEQRASPRGDLMHFLGVFKQICETVAFAHARGVIHRDLKPANIMVGAFGEVQVMDWGLAKRLQWSMEDQSDSSSAGDGRADEQAMSPNPEPSDCSTPHSGPPRTFAGAVIGTPAYMPPEQTGLGPHAIDERADVFSLGAILCEILTGQPPYTGADSNETFEQARAAVLDPAAQRLATCGADAGLVKLARRCLCPDPADRIESAFQIAAELEAGFESLQERLRDAELAHARQEQQRQRRRLQTALVIAVSLLVTTLTGGWALVARENQLRHGDALKQGLVALGEAGELRKQALLHPLDGESTWIATRDAISRAESIAADITDADLLESVRQLSSEIARDAAAARRDRDLIARLDAADAPVYIPDMPELRLDAQPPAQDSRDGVGRERRPPPPSRGPNQFGGPPDRPRPPLGRRRGVDPPSPERNRPEMEQAVYVELTTDRYIDALSEFELDPRRVTSERAAAFFMTRPDEVRIGVTDALDSWLSMLCQPSSNEPGHRDWVREVLARIDPNPLRTSIRAMASAADQDALRLVADDQSLLDQSPAFIWLVAAQLDNPDDTIRLLRQARARHPESLLLNHQLGEQLVHNRRGLEATDAYIAALAIKPDAPTNVRAAFLLADHDRYDESIAMFRNAIRIDPECGEAYARLAEILTWLNRAPEAILVTDEALANLPRDHEDAWQFHVARGEACEQLQEREAALLAYRLALNLDSMPTSDRTDILDRVSRLETPHSE